MIQKEPLKQKLRAYVDEQIPKLRTVSVADLESMGETFKPEDLMDATTLEAQEIVDSFRLSLVTESLTEEYSKTFLIGARKYGADWLENYISGFWEPDELGHADPFKKILLSMGINQKSIEDEIAEAKETTDYHKHHKSGIHPIELTTYGTIQECITDYWYELQRSYLPENSNTSRVVSKVKGREALHTVQFRNLTAMQLDAEPELIDNVIQATLNFQMPGNEIRPVKHIESKTQSWIPRMNGEVMELLKRIIDNLRIALDDKEKLGKLFIQYASRSDLRLIRFVPNRLLAQAITKLRLGYGIVGEIVLEQIGLVTEEERVPKNALEEIEFRIKNVMKRWAKQRLYLEGFFGKNAQMQADLAVE